MNKGDLVIGSSRAVWKHDYFNRYQKKLKDFDIDLYWPDPFSGPYLIIDDVCPEIKTFISLGSHSALLGRRFLKLLKSDSSVSICDAFCLDLLDENFQFQSR